MSTARQTKIEEAMQTLREAGYFVDSFWHIDEVKDRTDEPLTDEDCHDILYDALTNPSVTMIVEDRIDDELENLLEEY